MDTNGDGLLNVRVLKRCIRNNVNECMQIPENVAHLILEIPDDDANQYLDFDGFYELSLQHEELLTKLVKQYWELIIPSSHRLRQNEGGEFLF